MAKATKILPPPTENFTVQLDLDRREAEMLLAILGKFAGQGNTSGIYSALSGINGVRYDRFKVFKLEGLNGSVPLYAVPLYETLKLKEA